MRRNYHNERKDWNTIPDCETHMVNGGKQERKNDREAKKRRRAGIYDARGGKRRGGKRLNRSSRTLPFSERRTLGFGKQAGSHLKEEKKDRHRKRIWKGAGKRGQGEPVRVAKRGKKNSGKRGAFPRGFFLGKRDTGVRTGSLLK